MVCLSVCRERLKKTVKWMGETRTRYRQPLNQQQARQVQVPGQVQENPVVSMKGIPCSHSIKYCSAKNRILWNIISLVCVHVHTYGLFERVRMNAGSKSLTR